MENGAKTYAIGKIKGEVLVHHPAFGWIRAREGMGFPDTTRITIKTARDAAVEIVNASGKTFQIPERSLKLIDGSFTEVDIDTLRFIKVNAREMKAARRWTRLARAI